MGDIKNVIAVPSNHEVRAVYLEIGYDDKGNINSGYYKKEPVLFYGLTEKKDGTNLEPLDNEVGNSWWELDTFLGVEIDEEKDWSSEVSFRLKIEIAKQKKRLEEITIQREPKL